MTLHDYLTKHREPVPDWLDDFQEGTPFSRHAFFGSRLVYYPGSGLDGQPVRVFGASHSAHCFVYVDHGITQSHLEHTLDDPNRGFLGYQSLARIQLRETELVPSGWTPHGRLDEGRAGRLVCGDGGIESAPFGFLEVLERNLEFDDSHGARRLAILFLGAGGTATYDALFCQEEDHSAPFALVLADGFGTYGRFGRDGLLERIAQKCDAIPQWQLVANNTIPWRGFEQVPDADGDEGSSHPYHRKLYRRSKELS